MAFSSLSRPFDIGIRQAERNQLRPATPEQADRQSVDLSRYGNWESAMDVTTLLLIILIILLVGGGGLYGRGRWY